MRTAPGIAAVVLFLLAFSGMLTGLFVTLGHATIDDPACPGQTFYTIWGFSNACTSTEGGPQCTRGTKCWEEAANAQDIMNYDGLGVVIALALSLAAATLTLFRRPREGAMLGTVSYALMITVVMLFSIGLRNYTSHPLAGAPQGLGLGFDWGWYVLLASLPLLFAALVCGFRASWPVPPTPRLPGEKPVFDVPPRGIRKPEQKTLRVLPHYKPEPRAEEPAEELSDDGQAPAADWKTRLKSQQPARGKFRF
ncbi:MAG: hypothetical protein ACYDBQ_09665 [Thermoplasmatota archaeon]